MNRPDRDPGVPSWLGAWRDEPLSPAERTPAQASRQIQHVGQVLRRVNGARQRQRYFRHVAAGLAVAAGVVALTLGDWGFPNLDAPASVFSPEHGARLRAVEGVVSVTAGAGQPVDATEPLDVGAELATRAGRGELVFASGSSCALSAETQVRIVDAGARGRETLSLSRGRVDIEVPKRPDPIAFSVETPDARVVVHGTRFSVEVDPLKKNGATRVAVSRGIVSVHARGQEFRLGAGQSWPDPEAPAASSPLERAAGEPGPEATRAADLAAEPKHEEPAPKASPARPRAKARAAKAVRAAAAKLSAARLAEENALFAAAMGKKKAGDANAALQDLERFLQRYPDSVLRQEAEVERFRLLSRVGRPKDAARRARAYLGDYPDGYARQEARDLALEKP